MKRLLERALTVGQIHPHEVNQIAANRTAYLTKFWNGEYARVKTDVDAKQKDLLGQIDTFRAELSQQQANMTAFRNVLRANSSEQVNLIHHIVPARINASVAQVQHTLSDTITTELAGDAVAQNKANISRQFTTYANGLLSRFQSDFNQSLDQMGDLITDRINATIGVSQRAMNAVAAVYNESEAAFEDQWDALTGVLNVANAGSKAYLINDEDLGDDSIANFKAVKADIERLMMEHGAMNQEQLNQINFALTNASSNALYALNQLLEDYLSVPENSSVVSGTLPSLAEWRRYSAELTANTIPLIESTFSSALNQVAQQVMGTVAASTSGLGSNLSDPRIAALLNNTFTFVTQAELDAVSNFTNTDRSVAFNLVTAQLAKVMTALNSSGKTIDLDVIEQDGSNRLSRVDQRIQDVLDAEAAQDEESFQQARAALIDGPSAAGIEAAYKVQDQLKVSVRRMDDIKRRLALIAPAIVDAKQTLAKAGGATQDYLDQQTGRIATAVERQASSVDQAIRNFVGMFTDDLPRNTGLGQIALDKMNQLSSLTNWIRTTQSALETRFRDKLRAVDNYMLTKTRAETSIKSIREVLDATDRIPVPDFSSMNDVKDLSMRLDTDIELNKLNRTVGMGVQRAVSDFNGKQMQLDSALVAAENAKTDRDTKLAALITQAGPKSDSSDQLQSAYSDKLTGLVGNLNSTMDQYTQELSAVSDSNGGQYEVISQLLVDEIADLRHQEEESAPAFLSEYETERIAALLARLKAINGTISSIIASKPPAAAQASFIHQATPAPSRELVKIMSGLNDQSAVDGIKREISASVRSVEKLIQAHRPPFVNVTEQPDADAESFRKAAVAVLGRAERLLPGLLAALHAGEANATALLDSHNRDNITTLRAELEAVDKVLAMVTRAREVDIANRVQQLRERVSGLNETVVSIAAIPDRYKPIVLDDLTNVSKPDVPVVPKSRRAEALAHWVDSLRGDVDTTMADKMKAEMDKINGTLAAISEVHDRLTEMSRTEGQIEADFDTRILVKLRNRNAKQNQKLDDEVQAVKVEVEQAGKETGDKADGDRSFMAELHDSIRRLRG